MPPKATFIVYGWVERHYRLEIEASSHEEAEEIAERRLDSDRPQDMWDYEEGSHVRISDVECQDPDWDEDIEQEEAC